MREKTPSFFKTSIKAILSKILKLETCKTCQDTDIVSKVNLDISTDVRL